jgi:hypothetical protein
MFLSDGSICMIKQLTNKRIFMKNNIWIKIEVFFVGLLTLYWKITDAANSGEIFFNVSTWFFSVIHRIANRGRSYQFADEPNNLAEYVSLKINDKIVINLQKEKTYNITISEHKVENPT